jgi:small subunit ribosomal protein S19
MVKQFSYKGRPLEEIKQMSLEDFAKIVPSRSRRALKRGFTDVQKNLLLRIKKNPGKFHKVQCRDMIVIPEMLGVKMGIHNGKEYVTVQIIPEMLGHRLGDFAMTRKQVKHSAPGFGATRSSKYVPLK